MQPSNACSARRLISGAALTPHFMSVCQPFITLWSTGGVGHRGVRGHACSRRRHASADTTPVSPEGRPWTGPAMTRMPGNREAAVPQSAPFDNSALHTLCEVITGGGICMIPDSVPGPPSSGRLSLLQPLLRSDDGLTCPVPVPRRVRPGHQPWPAIRRLP